MEVPHRQVPPIATRRGGGFPTVSLLLVAVAIVAFLIPQFSIALQYDRAAIAGGELWRLFSGHLTHWSAGHLTWDVLAFGALAIPLERRSRRELIACLLGASFAISVAIYAALPGMQTYRGLSGADSALFGILAVNFLLDGRKQRNLLASWVGALLIAAFITKVWIEAASGSTIFVHSTREAPFVPVPSAHAVGAAVGVAVALMSHCSSNEAVSVSASGASHRPAEHPC